MFGAPMVKIPGAHWCFGGPCHPQHHTLSGLSVAHGASCPLVTRALAAEPGREGRGSYQAYSVQYRQPHGRAIRRPKKTPHAELCGPGRPRHIRSIARRAQDPRGAPRRRQTRRLRCPNHATHILKNVWAPPAPQARWRNVGVPSADWGRGRRRARKPLIRVDGRGD